MRGGSEVTWDRILKWVAAAAGAVAGLFGGWSRMHTILAVFMIVDYLTGCVVAALGRSPKTEGGGLSSKAGFVGLAKKGFMLAVVLLATLLDGALGSQAAVFQGATLCYYIANEGLSILENAALMDVPFPDKLRKALETLRDRESRE